MKEAREQNVTHDDTRKTFDAGEVFGISAAKGVEIQGFKKPHPDYTPANHPNYDLMSGDLPERLRMYIRWRNSRRYLGNNDGLWLWGDSGCGKTTFIEQVEAMVNGRVITIVCHRELEASDVFGAKTLENGSIVFQPGPAYIAAQKGYTLVLEEGDRLHPVVAGAMAILMEGRPVQIPDTDVVLHPHEDFALAVTANTPNGLDTNGAYVGAQAQNLAYLDRFQVIEFGYPSKEAEKAIVCQAIPGLPTEFVETMIDVADQTRKLFRGEDDGSVTEAMIDKPITTRGLLRWALQTAILSNSGDENEAENPLKGSLNQACMGNASPETREAVHQILDAHVGD